MIYNILGEEIVTIVDKYLNAGDYSVKWDGKDSKGNPVSSGIYLYQLRSNSFTKTNKMIFLR